MPRFHHEVIQATNLKEINQYCRKEKVDVDPLLLGPFSPGCLRVCFIASLLVSSAPPSAPCGRSESNNQTLSLIGLKYNAPALLGNFLQRYAP